LRRLSPPARQRTSSISAMRCSTAEQSLVPSLPCVLKPLLIMSGAALCFLARAIGRPRAVEPRHGFAGTNSRTSLHDRRLKEIVVSFLGQRVIYRRQRPESARPNLHAGRTLEIHRQISRFRNRSPCGQIAVVRQNDRLLAAQDLRDNDAFIVRDGNAEPFTEKKRNRRAEVSCPSVKLRAVHAPLPKPTPTANGCGRLN
jgi:hypothetical protein